MIRDLRNPKCQMTFSCPCVFVDPEIHFLFALKNYQKTPHTNKKQKQTSPFAQANPDEFS